MDLQNPYKPSVLIENERLLRSHFSFSSTYQSGLWTLI